MSLKNSKRVGHMLIYDLSLQNKIKICNWFHVNKLISVHFSKLPSHNYDM